MKLKIKILISLCFLIVCCKTKQDDKNLDSTKFNKPENLLIDTSNYSNLPYWTDSIDRFSEAYIDNFIVGQNKFRFVNPIASHRTGMNLLTLQKLVGNKWTKTNLTLEDSPHGGNYFHNKDINGDGYNDIEFGYRYDDFVYFFNPKTNTFFDTPAKEIVNPDWFLIDKKKNIYCDFQEYNGFCNDIHSKLYTYNGFQKINLYDLTLYNCTEKNNEKNLITKLILSKHLSHNSDSLKLIDEIKLDKPIDTDKGELLKQYSDSSYYFFDYRKFWKDRYKKLIGSS